MTSNVTGYDVFRYYRTLKLHYTQSSYSAVKYGYYTKAVSKKAYEAQENVRALYERAAKQFKTRVGVHRYFSCQLFWNPNAHISDLCDKEEDTCKRRWMTMRKFLITPDYYIKSDLESVLDKYGSQGIFGNEKILPAIADLARNDSETLAYTVGNLIHFTDWVDVNDDLIGGNIIWEMKRDLFKKLSPFVMVSEKDTKYDAIGNSIQSIYQKAITHNRKQTEKDNT